MTPDDLLRLMAPRADQTWAREEMTSFEDLLSIRDLEDRHLIAFAGLGGPHGMYARWRLTAAGRARAHNLPRR